MFGGDQLQHSTPDPSPDADPEEGEVLPHKRRPAKLRNQRRRKAKKRMEKDKEMKSEEEKDEKKHKEEKLMEETYPLSQKR